VKREICTRCDRPLRLRAFRVATVDGERHTICHEPELPVSEPLKTVNLLTKPRPAAFVGVLR